MLPGLGHDAFVGGHDKQGKVDTTDARQHVLDEALMAGHVNDTHLTSRGKLEPGKTELDGHAPLFLLAETVGVNAGKGFNQN